jgi:hypothetical protein
LSHPEGLACQGQVHYREVSFYRMLRRRIRFIGLLN